MTIRKLLLPGVIAAAVMSPVALAQADLGAKGVAALGAQVGPVAATARVGIDAAAQSDAEHEAADAAKARAGQVGGKVKNAARGGAKAANKASIPATGAVAGNAKAAANAAVSGKAATEVAEPEEEDEH